MNEVEQDALPTDPQEWISGDMWAIDWWPWPSIPPSGPRE